MNDKRYVKSAVTGMAALFSLAVCPIAQATTCFSAFGGAIHYHFSISSLALKTPGTKTFSGQTFGALVPCAGLDQWPVTATANVKNGQIILGFRAMTVDAAGCGAVDYIVNLDPHTLSGPLELHNDRNNFSNTSTLAPAACVNPPSATALAPLSSIREDLQGNRVP